MICPVCKLEIKGSVCRYCELESQLFASMEPGEGMHGSEFYEKLGEMARMLLADDKRRKQREAS